MIVLCVDTHINHTYKKSVNLSFSWIICQRYSNRACFNRSAYLNISKRNVNFYITYWLSHKVFSLFLALNMKTAIVLILALCASAMVSANSCSDTCLAKYTACEQSCRDMWAHSHQYDTCATSCTDERAFCDSKCHGGSGK